MANEASKPETNVNGGVEDKQQLERTKEWSELVNQINTLKAKIKSKEETVKEIISHKHHAKNKAEAEHAVTNLIVEHKELVALEEEYNTKAQMLKYQYPDVGITEKRKYERMKLKSVDEYEQIMTIEGRIKRAVIKAKQHYGIKEQTEEPKKVEKPLEYENNPLAAPIILKK